MITLKNSLDNTNQKHIQTEMSSPEVVDLLNIFNKSTEEQSSLDSYNEDRGLIENNRKTTLLELDQNIPIVPIKSISRVVNESVLTEKNISDILLDESTEDENKLKINSSRRMSVLDSYSREKPFLSGLGGGARRLSVVPRTICKDEEEIEVPIEKFGLSNGPKRIIRDVESLIRSNSPQEKEGLKSRSASAPRPKKENLDSSLLSTHDIQTNISHSVWSNR